MKKKIQEEIFYKNFEGYDHDIRFSDLPKDLKENDIIYIQREESYYSENNSWDAYTKLMVIRERDETEEEYQKRIIENQKFKKELNDRRYENYLKLKEEFEKK